MYHLPLFGPHNFCVSVLCEVDIRINNFNAHLKVTLQPSPQPGEILSPREHSAMTGDISDCYNWGWGCYRYPVGTARDTAKHSSRQRTVPYKKELGDSKHQQC